MQIQPAQFNSPTFVYGEKILGTGYLPGSGYDGVAARAGLVTFSLPAQSFFRKVYLYMDLILLTPNENGYILFGTVNLRFGGQLVAKMPAQMGQDMQNSNNTIHMLGGKSVPNRFPNPTAPGRDALLLSIANPTVDTDTQNFYLTPAFIGVQADEISFDLDAIRGWQWPSDYKPTGFRVWLGVESSPFPY